MNWINVDGMLLNLDTIVAVHNDESGDALLVQTTHREVRLGRSEATRKAYDWLVDRCVATFAAEDTSEQAPENLSKDAWKMLLRVERHEQRTGMVGLPIDDDDMDTTIELERKTLIRTDVHHAWLTDQGKEMLAGYRAANAEDSGEDSETQG